MKNKTLFALIFCILFGLTTNPAYAQDTVEYPVYLVKTGDTLNSIAILFDVTTDEITQLNNISDPDSIYPGMSLMIPGLPGISGILTPSVIGLGESWNQVLIKYQLNEESAIRLNKLLNPSGIYTGTKLLLPLSNNDLDFGPKAQMEVGSTFLEKAVILESNPDILLIKNRKESIFQVFPTELIFDNSENLQNINPFSSRIDSLSISPLPLTQGDTVVVQIRSPQPITLSGQLAGYPLRFFSDNGADYFALQGIHAMAETGLTDFSISGSNGSQQIFSIQNDIYLSPGSFDEDPPLKVNPQTIDPRVTQPEQEQIETIVASFTPQKYWQGEFISPDRDYGLGMDSDYYQDIISSFGSRRTYNDDPTVTFHTGVDFGGGESLPIVAPAAGRVVFADSRPIRGNATIIDHGLGVYSAYYHQSKILVNVGDLVTAGQKIGEVGNTGRVDRADEYEGAGAHLHWEMWVNGVQVNPMDWVFTQYP